MIPRHNRAAFLLASLALLFGLSLLPAPLPAAEKGPKGTVRVGIFPFAPLNYINEEGEARGLNPELLREIIRDEDWKIEFVPVSWAEGLERLQKGEIDLMPSVAYSEERSKVMDYSYESVAELWGQVFIRPDGASKNISDLAGRRVAIMRNDISGKNFLQTAEKLSVQCDIVELSTHAEVFAAVQKGEVDAGVAPQHFGLRHAGEYDLAASSIMFSPFSIYFASKKGAQHELLSHIDAHLSRWKRDKDSFYYQQLNYWMGAYSSRWSLSPWIVYGFLTVSGAGFVFAGFSWFLKRTVDRKTRELRQSEERFRLAMDATKDGLWDWDIAANTVYYSPGYWQMLGYDDQSRPYSPEAWIETIHPDDRDLVLTTNEDCIANRSASFVVEYRMKMHQGDWKWIQGRGKAVARDADGRALRMVGTHVDISERKQAEEDRKNLHAQLVKMQKLEAIGTLAGGIAHDFNNILGAILGYAEMARETLPSGSMAANDLDKVLESGHRAAALVKQILAFSRQAKTERIPLRPVDVVKEVVGLLRPSLPSTIAIRLRVDPGTKAILADPTQIHQILMNLCTNAFHAMELRGGILEIGIEERVLSRHDLQHQPKVHPGRFVLLSVSDSGSGISPEIRDKIFDPYFTTKTVGKGTGMGLAIVHGIITSYGGFITCESTEGTGTVFRLYFPALNQEEAAAKPQPAEAIPLGTERLLLVDDEEILAGLGKEMLERLGYEVVAHTSSVAAWAAFQEQPERFDAVITDQTMPAMTGIDLAQRILAIRPEIPIILCTGYSSLVSEEQARAGGITAFILKPLTRRSIASLLRQVLAHAPETAGAATDRSSPS